MTTPEFSLPDITASNLKPMTRQQATDYVCEHARYQDRFRTKRAYSVRWPTPYSHKALFSDDTNDLAQQVYTLGKNKKWPVKP